MVNYTCSTCSPCMIQSIYIGHFVFEKINFIDVCSHFIQLLIIVSLWSISSICYPSIVKNYWRFYFIHVVSFGAFDNHYSFLLTLPFSNFCFALTPSFPFPLPHIFSIVPFIYPFLENFPYPSIAPNHSPFL